ncbi:MAG: WD40 repeat domain-containing protein [Phototrophicaceae bacterium]
MSKNDFLYALKDDLPDDFSASLREQLNQMEQEEHIQENSIQPKQNSSKRWLLPLVAIFAVVFGMLILVNEPPSMDVLNIAQALPPSLTNHGEITPETVDNLQLITTLGNGFARLIRVSPDGNTVLVDSSAGLYLHDANNISAPPRRIMVEGDFHVVDYADDGMIYGVTFGYGTYIAQQVMRVDPSTGQSLILFDLPQAFLYNFEISNDGSRFSLQACFEERENRFCDDNEWVTQIYDTQTGTLGLEFASHYAFGNANYIYNSYSESTTSHLSDDGNYYTYILKEGSIYNIHLMDIQTGQSQAILRIGTENQLTSRQWIQLSPDSQTLLVSRFPQISVWDIDRLINADSLTDSQDDDPDRGVSMDTRKRVIYHPDNQTLIGIGDNIIHNYDFTTGEAYSEFESDLVDDDLYSSVEITPDADALYAIVSTGELVRYSYPEGMVEETTSLYDTGWGRQFMFLDDTQLLSSSNNYSGAVIREWGLDTNEPASEIFQPNGGIIYPIRREIILSLDGRYLQYSGRQVENNTSTYNWLHNLETGERHRMSLFSADKGGVITHDNRLIGLGSNLAYIYDIENIINNENFNQDYIAFYLENEYISGWSSYVSDIVSLGLDGRLMATLPCLPSNPSTSNVLCDVDIALWDLVNGRVSYTIELEADRVALAVALSENSNLLAVSSCEREGDLRSECRELNLYDVSELPINDTEGVQALDLVPIMTLDNLTHNVNSISFNPTTFDDGSRLIAVSDNQSLTTFIQVYADGTVETLATLAIQNKVTFSPNGNLVLTNNQRGEIEIWGVPSNRGETVVQATPQPIAISSRDVITPRNISQAENVLTFGNGHANYIALSPDDQTLAVASTTGIYLHDAQNINAEARYIGSPSEEIRYIKYTDNGDLLVVNVFDDLLGFYRWDESSNNFIALYGSTGMSGKVIQHIDISPDGNQLLIATCEGNNGVFFVATYSYCQSPAIANIQLIDLNNPDNEVTIPIQSASNSIVAVNPDWSQLAYFDNGFINIYTIATGETKRIIEIARDTSSSARVELPTGKLWSLAFTPDGSEFGYLGALNDNFIVWSVDELNQVEDGWYGSVANDSEFFNSSSMILTFHPHKNERLVIRSDSIDIFSVDDMQLDGFEDTLQAREIVFNSDGEQVYILGTTGEIQVHDWATRSQITTNTDYNLSTYMTPILSDDGQLIVNNDNNSTNNGSISFVWDINNPNDMPQILTPDDSVAQPNVITAISPDNRYIAYVHEYNIYVYDRELDEHRQIDIVFSLIDLEFRADGSLITIITERGYGFIKTYTPEQLAIGDIRYPHDGVQIETLVFGGGYGNSSYMSPLTRSVTLSPDAETIAIQHCNNFLRFFSSESDCDVENLTLVDALTGEIIADLESPITEGVSLQQFAFSANGQYLSMSYCADTIPQGWDCEENQGAVDIWRIEDIRNGQLTPHMTITDLPRSTIAFIPYNDGSVLLKTSAWENVTGDVYDPFTRFWSVTADGNATEIYMIDANVTGFSADGRMMLVVDDAQIEVWAIPRDSSTASSE